MVLERESLLLEVAGALRPACRLAGALHRGKQEADEHRDDRDDDEQLHERETASCVIAETRAPDAT
jgi:hypothetical protein